jgi:hypothetical protein
VALVFISVGSGAERTVLVEAIGGIGGVDGSSEASLGWEREGGFEFGSSVDLSAGDPAAVVDESKCQELARGQEVVRMVDGRVVRSAKRVVGRLWGRADQ